MLAGFFALAPQAFAAAAVIADPSGAQRLIHRGAIHPCHHQHFAGIVLLGDGGDQAGGVEFQGQAWARLCAARVHCKDPQCRDQGTGLIRRRCLSCGATNATAGARPNRDRAARSAPFRAARGRWAALPGPSNPRSRPAAPGRRRGRRPAVRGRTADRSRPTRPPGRARRRSWRSPPRRWKAANASAASTPVAEGLGQRARVGDFGAGQAGTPQRLVIERQEAGRIEASIQHADPAPGWRPRALVLICWADDGGQQCRETPARAVRQRKGPARSMMRRHVRVRAA